MDAALAAAGAKTRSSRRPRRGTFGWPQECSGKLFGDSGRESRLWGTVNLNWEHSWAVEGSLQELLNPTNMSSWKEAELEDISLAGSPRWSRSSSASKAPGVDKIRPEILKALDIFGRVG